MPTGRPFTLRCYRCKRGENYRNPNRMSAEKLFRTGRERIAKSYHGRYNVTLREVTHAPCGWIGWTDHLDAKKLPLLSVPPMLCVICGEWRPVCCSKWDQRDPCCRACCPAHREGP